MLEIILLGILVVLIMIARNIKLIGERLIKNSETEKGPTQKEED